MVLLIREIREKIRNLKLKFVSVRLIFETQGGYWNNTEIYGREGTRCLKQHRICQSSIVNHELYHLSCEPYPCTAIALVRRLPTVDKNCQIPIVENILARTRRKISFSMCLLRCALLCCALTSSCWQQTLYVCTYVSRGFRFWLLLLMLLLCTSGHNITTTALACTQGPSMLKKGSTQDGPTVHAVFYFSLREETARALDNLHSADPSVRLLAEYFRWESFVSSILFNVSALCLGIIVPVCHAWMLRNTTKQHHDIDTSRTLTVVVFWCFYLCYIYIDSSIYPAQKWS